jgi:glycosyltransferase involved in cell wall biosynthesis
VTVVIPAYNAESFIAQAIESVLSQDHIVVQLIVVDDGSTDRTGSIADSVDDPRVTLVSGPNRGVSRARNIGLERAKGEAIGFLDADDYWLPNKLGVQLDALEEDPQLVAIGSLMRYESAQGRILGTAGQSVSREEQDLIAQARLMPFPLSSILFRTNIVADLGGFDEETPGQVEDLELMARLALVGKIRCVPEVLGVYRIHGKSVSAQDHKSQRAATRFVRARLRERERGGDLSREQFDQDYRPGWRQSYGDRVQAWYRLAGLRAAEQRWGGAIAYGSIALLAGPRYTVRRLRRQRGRARS